MTAPDIVEAGRRAWPAALMWAVLIAVMGYAFQAGIAWQRITDHGARITAIEEAGSVVTAIRIEMSGLRAELRALGIQVGQMQRRLESLSVEPVRRERIQSGWLDRTTRAAPTAIETEISMMLTPVQRLVNIIRELEDMADELAGDPPPVPEPGAVERPRLAVVVGHTRVSSGAVAEAPINAAEYEWNAGLASLMEFYAEKLGLCIHTFYRDQGGIAGAYASAGAWGAHAVVELHFNSVTDPRASGTVTLVSVNATPLTRRFAETVQAAMVRTLGLRDRGVSVPWQGRGEASLSALTIPSILVEPFFGSNPGDCAIANTRKAQLAEAIVLASAKFLEEVMR